MTYTPTTEDVIGCWVRSAEQSGRDSFEAEQEARRPDRTRRTLMSESFSYSSYPTRKAPLEQQPEGRQYNHGPAAWIPPTHRPIHLHQAATSIPPTLGCPSLTRLTGKTTVSNRRERTPHLRTFLRKDKDDYTTRTTRRTTRLTPAGHRRPRRNHHQLHLRRTPKQHPLLAKPLHQPPSRRHHPSRLDTTTHGSPQHNHRQLTRHRAGFFMPKNIDGLDAKASRPS